MKQPSTDTRVTAYAFGEMSAQESAAFEKELSQSEELRAELAEVREAISALENEFRSESHHVTEQQRVVIQNAFQVATPPTPPPLNEPIQSEWSRDRAYRRALTVAILTTCALLLMSFVLPYLRENNQQSVASNPALGRSADGESQVRDLVDQFNRAIDERRLDDAKAIAQQFESQFSDHPIARTLAHLSEQARVGSNQSIQPELGASGQSSASVSGDVAAEMSESAVGDRTQDPLSRSRGGYELNALDSSVTPPGSAGDSSETTMESGIADPLGDVSLQASSEESRETKPGSSNSVAQSSSLTRRKRRRANQSMSEMLGGMGMGMEGSEVDPTASGGMGMGGMGMGGGGMGMGIGVSEMEAGEIDEMGMGGMGMGGMGGMGVADSGGMGVGVMNEDAEADAFGMEAMMGMGAPSGEMVSSGESKKREILALGLQREGRDRFSGDRFSAVTDNPFFSVSQAPLSTFSVDVDTASYAKVRGLLNHRVIPNPDAVRIEELVNYFDYDYAEPSGEHPFSASLQVVECPWNSDHQLARVGIQGKRVGQERPFSNLVFLLDVSGSMDEPDKLPLVIEGMKMLTTQLTENDRLAIVVYAGAAGVVLDSTRGDKTDEIFAALDRLRAGGGTNGGEGIQLAYQIARDNFVVGGTNRVILCSDGDFNLGVTGTEEVVQLAKEQAQSNIFLTILGFGHGNHNDQMMEQVSNQANGNYAFIDGSTEARKVLVEELSGTLVTIAKDVKIQVEFNPTKIAGYRLVGYENRVMAAADFENDKKDAGEIGAGHRVTALYELIPKSSDPDDAPQKETIDLRYQVPARPSERADSDELLILKLRYKQPDGERGTTVEFPVLDQGMSFRQADRDLKLAAAVAGFGMLLRNSPHRGDLTMSAVEEMARESARGDDYGYRTEFVKLVQKARQLRGD